MTRLPVPVFVVIAVVIVAVIPECARFVAAGVDEVQILAVRHLVLIDGKRRDVEGVGFILVVPPK
jgi:hypothetical protein